MRKLLLCAALCGAPLALNLPARAQVAAPAQTSIPDVSQLEYRAVTLDAPGKSLFGVSPTLAAHLWVVPARDGEPALGIGWNGVPYQLQSIGAKADWRADVEAFLDPKTRVYLPSFGFSGLPVARQLLMQLGAADLQRVTGEQIRLFGPNNPQADYLQNLRDAGVSSFAAGQFSQAQLQLNHLLEVWPAKTLANIYDLRPEARQILADIARRAGDTPRPDDEIAGLIWDLQNVRAHQMMVPGAIIWTANPTIQKLIDVGDRAIPPLLDDLQNDDRLTFSFYAARGQRSTDRIATVRDAAQSALEVLTQTSLLDRLPFDARATRRRCSGADARRLAKSQRPNAR